MTLQNARIYQGQPETSETSIYTVGTDNVHTKLHKMEVVMTNTSDSEASVSLSLVPSGSAAGPANRLIPASKVPAKSVATIQFNQFMGQGDFLSALQCTNGAVTLTITGMVE